MKTIFRKDFILLIIWIAGCGIQQSNREHTLAELFQKEEVKIIVTDSGLGGLSVAADLYERLSSEKMFRKTEIIYFNSQPHLSSGYNMQKSERQKILIFENALRAMYETYRPDAILIACNTLSVLYDQTEFSKMADIPVAGIVETGVQLISNRMQKNPGSKVIILATPTTIGQATHKKQLIQKGINEDQIVMQACPDLPGAIERGPLSDSTANMIDTFVLEAIEKLGNAEDSLYVSYNCTHYGYSHTLFKQAFERAGYAPLEYIDPNPYMSDLLFEHANDRRYERAEVAIEVISQAEIPGNKLNSIMPLIRSISPSSAEALRNYQFKPGMFEWESIQNME